MSSSIVDEQLVSGYKRKWIHVAVTTILSPIQDTHSWWQAIQVDTTCIRATCIRCKRGLMLSMGDNRTHNIHVHKSTITIEPWQYLPKVTHGLTAANLPVVDVRLTAVDDSDNAEPHWYNAATQYVYGVSAMVHEIKLRYHRQRSSAWFVITRQTQSTK